MMEVVIVDDGNRLTVYELVERVIPCIIAKHYSENYIQGFRSTFRNLLAYCNKNEKKYFTAELAQQFMLDCYGVQPGTVERRWIISRNFPGMIAAAFVCRSPARAIALCARIAATSNICEIP